MEISAPLLLFILFEMGLCRFSLLIDRLLAMPMREVGMVRRCLVSASSSAWPLLCVSELHT
jgi:hypothetical protein